MGFSEKDLPEFDVTFGQVRRVESSIEERQLTAAESEDVDAVLAAVAVLDDARSEVPELAKPENAEHTERGRAHARELAAC
jgi:hypothetical protein